MERAICLTEGVNNMENDTIYRQTAIDAVQGIDRIATLPDNDAVVRMSAVEYVLFNLPPAQPERNEGKWTSILGGTFFKCAVCDYDEVYDKKYNFCPNCGADMRGVINGNQ